MRTKATIFKASEFKALAMNDQGASYVVGNDMQYPSVRAAKRAARAEMGSGWRIKIIDVYTGAIIETFRIR
jgi:hypothetical protein